MNQQQAEPKNDLFTAAGVSHSVRVYLPATAIYRGMSLARGVILVWLLARQTGQYGLLSIALQTINILAPLVSLGLNEAVTRYVPAYQTRGLTMPFLRLAVSLIAGVTLPVTALLLLFTHPLGWVIFGGDHPAEIAPLTRATFFAIAAIIAYFLIVALLKGLRMFPALAYMELFHGTLFLVFSLAAALLIGPHAEYIVWSYTLAMIIPTLIWGGLLIRRLSSEKVENLSPETGPLFRRLIGYGFWAAIAGIIWQTWQVYALWHLTRYDTALHSDIFATSRLIGQLIMFLGIAISGVVMTSACTVWEQGRHSESNFLFDFYSKLTFLFLLLCGMLIITARGPLEQIFPRQLSRISDILPQVLLFYQLSTILSFLAIQFTLIEKMRLMLWSWLIGLAANIFLAFLLIKPDRALVGAAEAATWSMLPAILVTLCLIRAEGQPISIGLVILTLASMSLLAPVWLAWTGLAVLLAWAIFGSQIFDVAQKNQIRAKISATILRR